MSRYTGCFDGVHLVFFSDEGAGHEMVRVSPDSAGGIVVSYWRDARGGGQSDGDGWFSEDWADGEVAGIDGSDPLLVAACEAFMAGQAD